MSDFICGTELPDTVKAEVLRDYAPKFTSRGPEGLQWLASRGFYVTRAGRLDKRHQQAWPLFKKPADTP